MAIEEKVSQEDLILYEVLRHPVFCGEFIYNFDLDEYDEPFVFSDYQQEMLCDFNPYVSICTARATGKTVSETSILIWALIYQVFPNDYILYTVPNKVHLEPVFANLTRNFRTNSFLKNFIEPKGGINNSEYKVSLLNGSTLLCRIAGQTGTGVAVVGLHTPFELLDESGFYPWGTWIELQPTLNTFTPGFRMIVAGVPSGLRESNVNYHCDQENSSYSKHRVSAYENPRFTEEDELRAIEQYGGKESDDFIHLVLGQHGAPIFSVFDRRLFEIENYPVYKLTLDGLKMRDGLEEYVTKLSLLPQAPQNQGLIIGADLGYTDPTAIFVMYLDKHGVMRFHAKIQLNKVSYNIQDRFIDLLDTKFKPSIIGVDEGSTGKAVIQRMMEANDFAHKNYKKRLIPINFSSSVSLGVGPDGNEIKSRTKPFSVSVLQDYSNNHKVVYSSTDQETVSELERMTYSKNITGDITYKTLTPKGGKKGEDHFTSALLCAVLAYYMENELLSPQHKSVKLYQPRWFI